MDSSLANVTVHEPTGSHGPRGDHDHGGGEGVSRGRVAEIVAAAALLLIGLVFNRNLHALAGGMGEYAVLLTAYALVGRDVVARAVRNVVRRRFFDEHSLMTIATVGAIAIHQLTEAVAVMLFYSVGELFQDLAVGRSRRSIRALLEMRPDHANVMRNGEVVQVDPETVRVGEHIVVRPGERIPLDGEIVEGMSLVDTSALTGEAVPRRVEAGDQVLAGMINTQGLLTIRVERPFAESSVARVLALVEEAAARKAPTERFITTFSRYYTPVVVVIALGIAAVPPLVIPGAQAADWIYRALVLLVISCPCALVLSVPLGYFAGLGGASKRGILIKGGNVLDALTELTAVAMDKTGTLTDGTFKVRDIAVFNGFDREQVLQYAALAESHSTHPIAESIRQAYGRPVDPDRAASVQEIAGHGVKARVGGRTVLAGNDRLLHREGVAHVDCEADGTVVFVAVDGVLAGRLTVGDAVKDDAARAVEELRDLGIGRIAILTGDDRRAAERVAERLGITEVYAQLLPEDKVRVVERFLAEAPSDSGRRRGRRRVAFVGDGINDAPVLTRADVGIAMGALGSDAAIETADVVIMDDSPAKVPQAVRTARRTRRIVLQNIALALAVKLVFIGLGAIGLASIWEAVFADVGVSLLAVLNATRALRA